MVEILLTLYILFAFIFPLPVLAVSVMVCGAYWAHRIHLLYRFQPGESKKIFWLLLSSSMANFILSLFLGVGLALMVRILFLDNSFLFVFNLIFCSLISLRWFNFTHRIFRYFILKFKEDRFPETQDEDSVFVLLFGLRQGTGINRGMMPVFADAGFMKLKDGAIQFNGIFSQQVFASGSDFRAEKKSAEKIIIYFTGKRRLSHLDGFQIVLRDQFYPFRSRQLRDKFYESFQRMEKLESLAA